MNWRRALIGLLTVVCAVGVSAPAFASTPPTSPAPSTSPASTTTPAPPVTPEPLGATASIPRPQWAIGEKMRVLGKRWDRGKVNVAVCGNLGLNGSTDCDQPSSRSLTVGSGGGFSTIIKVAVPPKPCPCVVLVQSENGSTVIRIKMDIVGSVSQLPSQNTPEAAFTTVGVTSAVKGGSSWRDAFGFGPSRTLTFTVVNTGKFATGNGAIDITVGKENPPIGFAGTVAFNSIEAGATATIVAHISLDAFAFGTYNIKARLQSPRVSKELALTTNTFPWFLVTALLLLVLIVDLIVVLRTRRKKQDALESDLATLSDAGVAAAASETAVPADGSLPVDYLTCVLEFRGRFTCPTPDLLTRTGADLVVVGGRSLVSVHGSAATKVLIDGALRSPPPAAPARDSEGSENPDEPATTAPAPVNHLDVVSILASDAAPLRDAHASSEALAAWLKSEHGLRIRIGDPTEYVAAFAQQGLSHWSGRLFDDSFVPMIVVTHP